MKRRRECIRRAARTLLQTVTGILTACVIAAATGMIGTVTGWRIALLTVIAAAVSALIAAIMNFSDGEEQ